MKTRTVLMPLLLAVAFLMNIGLSSAQEASPISPLLKENTFLAIHFDLKQIDVEAGFKTLKARMNSGVTKANKALPPGTPKAPSDRMNQGLDLAKKYSLSVMDMFRKNGIEEVYMVSRMEDAPGIIFWLAIPSTKPFGDEFDSFFAANHVRRVGSLDGMEIYAGLGDLQTATDPKESFETLKNCPTQERQDILRALKLQKKSPIRMVFAPSVGMRAMGKMMIPAALQQSPIPIDPKPVDRFIDSVESLSIGINPSLPRLNIAFQTESEEKATAIQGMLTETVNNTIDGLIKIGKDAAAAQGIRLTDAMIKRQTAQVEMMRANFIKNLPTAKKDLLILVIDEKKIEENELILVSLFLPAIIAAMDAAERMQKAAAQ